MTDRAELLLITIDSRVDADDEEQAELAQRLRGNLLELEVEAVDFVRPRKAAAGDIKGTADALGPLLVTLGAAGGVLTTLINTVQSFLARHERTTVTLEIGGDKIAITGISSEQEQRLIDIFVSRHEKSGTDL